MIFLHPQHNFYLLFSTESIHKYNLMNLNKYMLKYNSTDITSKLQYYKKYQQQTILRHNF